MYLIGVDNPFLDFSGSGYDFLFKAVTNIESLYIRNIHNLIINNCLFCNNDAQLQLIVIESVLNVEIFGCEFYQNKGQKDLTVSYLFFEMDNCRIYDNEVVVSTISMEGFNSQSMITVSNCLFSNNTSAGHVLIIAIDRLYMSNVNIISNKKKRIGTSIIQITQIHTNGKQHLNISNINFINNTGTGLKLKDATVYFNNITFYYNSGVYGGGMSLYHTHIYLVGPLRFENNKACFGGAIYIAEIESYEIVDDTYCTSFEQITFTGNFADTLGADVYIEDGYFVSRTILFTFSCPIDSQVKADHIISGPYNITINPQSNSTITVFPGQKLAYSAHVTDYFGNLTNCFINIFLQCGAYLIFCENVEINGGSV